MKKRKTDTDGSLSDAEVKKVLHGMDKDIMRITYGDYQETARILNGGHKEVTSILDVRDRLDNLKNLVTVCREALTLSDLGDIKRLISHVLYFHVEEQIKIAEQELSRV
jgi:sigma54-dependent transcription regulator